jgi:TPR repeat protein
MSLNDVYNVLFTGVVSYQLRDSMKCRALVPSLISVLVVASFLPAQTAPLSSNTRLAEILRLPALQPGDWQALFSIAEFGDPEAQYWLGRIYDAGRLLPLDKQKSDYWFQKSAEQVYAPAEYWVCMKRAKLDQLEHERCMWRAAENGVPEAQFWLGVAFDQNLWFGVTDKKEALKWYRRAAEGDQPDAEDELGVRYQDGDGVEQNDVQAAYWFRKAAEHVPNLGGAGQGRNNLGNLYEEGNGVPRDYVQAYTWFSLAGSDRSIAYIQQKMTPEQISRARQLAADWKLQYPDPAIF